MINQIGKITLYVNDQEEAKKFWTEKMNFVVKFEAQMGPNMTWLEVGPSKEAFTTFILYNKNLMEMQQPGRSLAHPNVILSTTDIEAAHAQMKSNGVEVQDIMTMPYGRMFGFKDQDGNDYLLREDK